MACSQKRRLWCSKIRGSLYKNISGTDLRARNQDAETTWRNGGIDSKWGCVGSTCHDHTISLASGETIPNHLSKNIQIWCSKWALSTYGTVWTRESVEKIESIEINCEGNSFTKKIPMKNIASSALTRDEVKINILYYKERGQICFEEFKRQTTTLFRSLHMGSNEKM